MESPAEKRKRLSLITNPNYDLPESEKMLPFEFQEQLEKRADSLAAPETVIGPLMTGSWGIIAAPPGVGKSMWLKVLIQAIASDKFGFAGDWHAPKRRSVFLIDAEMSAQELAGRYADACFGDWLGICTLDLLDRYDQKSFALGEPADQLALTNIAIDFEVIAIDNIEYTLDPAPGQSIFAPESWAQVEPLTRWAKANNKLLIFVDHTNREGGVQGTLSKQRGASFVIKLEGEYVEKADLSFTSHFVKYRNQVDKKLLRDRLWHFGNDYGWLCEVKESTITQVIEGTNQGMKRKQLAELVGCSPKTVSNILSRNKHLLTK